MNKSKSLIAGLLALGGLTVLSIDLSVAIPAAQTRAIHTETAAAWRLARRALREAGPHCQAGTVTHGGRVARIVDLAPGCTARILWPSGRGVPAPLVGARLTAVVQDGVLRCRAAGGHGATAADFPKACRYHSAGMLL